MNFPSKLIEDAVNEISKLPGIGKKSALRLVLFILKEEKSFTTNLTNAILSLRENIKYCSSCHNISDESICSICASPRRDRGLICIVEDTPDVLAIENTNHYNGLYHVLGGIISPVNGIGPSDLQIETLISRIKASGVNEVIFALSQTMEGDTTTFYITKRLKEFDIKISTIARGIPVGGELEYMDEITLGRSITSRVNYEQ